MELNYSCGSGSSSSSWAWLPIELLDSILGNVKDISDLNRFSVVCKHWQSAALPQKQQRTKSYLQKLATLMVTTTTKDVTLRGCSHGWLIYINEGGNNQNTMLIVTLLNPFTKDTIQLPPVPNMKINTTAGRPEYKVVLSADPGLFSDDYEALLISCSQKLAHFKSGDDAWTHINNMHDINTMGIIHNRGQFLALNSRGGLFAINVVSNVIRRIVADDEDRGIECQYLVESSAGDLLRVKGFKNVFKLSLISENLQMAAQNTSPHWWVKVESIGSDALFLGGRGGFGCMCVSTLCFPQCIPNSIYIVNRAFGNSDFEHYNMQTQQEQSYYYTNLLEHLSPPHSYYYTDLLQHLLQPQTSRQKSALRF